MAFRIGQSESPVSESHHAAAVGGLSGEQRGPARTARRRPAEGAPEQDSALSELLEVGRRHGMSIGLNVAPRIVGVNVEDIRLALGHGRLHCR